MTGAYDPSARPVLAGLVVEVFEVITTTPQDVHGVQADSIWQGECAIHIPLFKYASLTEIADAVGIDENGNLVRLGKKFFAHDDNFEVLEPHQDYMRRKRDRWLGVDAFYSKEILDVRLGFLENALAVNWNKLNDPWKGSNLIVTVEDTFCKTKWRPSAGPAGDRGVLSVAKA